MTPPNPTHPEKPRGVRPCISELCPPELSAQVLFTQSARRHRVGRSRVLAVLARPVAILPARTPDGRDIRMFLGDDDSGRALEVGVIELPGSGLLVIHAMDLRAKYRQHYQAGKEA